MSSFLQKLAQGLASFGFSCILLLFMMFLVWAGTMEQVDHGLYEVQKKYFDSFFLVHRIGPISIPLPGVHLLLCLMAVNLTIGGILRLRKSWSRAGILVAHLGIAMLLLSGFVKFWFATDGHMTLFEGENSAEYQSYHLWELAVIKSSGDTGTAVEYLIDGNVAREATPSDPIRFESGQIPFTVSVQEWFRNSRALPKGPMFDVPVPVVDGYFLQAQPPEKEAERNIAGCYVRVQDRSGHTTEGILWGLENYPFSVEVDGEFWGISLRKKRWPVPFDVTLEDFRVEFHPGTGMASTYESDIILKEGGVERPINISMNEPLRYRGYTFFQASWGPQGSRPTDRLFSTFAVVQNPADNGPLYACIVIWIGLMYHMLWKLWKYYKSQRREMQS